MNSPTRYSPEVRERAVRLVLEHQGEHDSQWSAIPSMASKLGCTAETLRKWVRQADRPAQPRLDAPPHVLRPVPRPENAAELVDRAHRIDRDLGVHRVRDPALHPHVERRALAHQGDPGTAPPRLVHPGPRPHPVTLRRRVRRDHAGPRLRVGEHRHRAPVQRRRLGIPRAGYSMTGIFASQSTFKSGSRMNWPVRIRAIS